LRLGRENPRNRYFCLSWDPKSSYSGGEVPRFITMKPALRIALYYALISGLYIVLSDAAVAWLAPRDPDVILGWQNLKGIVFIFLSALVIFFFVLHYVRSRDRTQVQFEAAHQSFEQLFQRNPIPVVVYNPDTLQILAVNEAAIQEYGYTNVEMLRMRLTDLCLPEELEKAAAHVARVKSGPYAGQWRQIRKDRSVFDIEIASHPIVFAGHPARLVAAVNVNARRLVERVAAEAFQAQAEADAAKTRFLATISHEMRTPMNAIIGFLELLVKEKDEERHREYAAIAQRSADDLLKLIERLIEAADLTGPVRGERVRATIEPEPFLRRITDDFCREASRKGISLQYRSRGPLPREAALDAGRLEAVLQILLGNAIKFSPGGVVELNAAQELEKSGIRLVFTVSDEGIGIPENLRHKVFEPFFQGEQEMNRSYGGMGLGLFVARQLCDLMGATLETRAGSGSGSGSAFTVCVSGKTDAEGRFTAL